MEQMSPTTLHLWCGPDRLAAEVRDLRSGETVSAFGCDWETSQGDEGLEMDPQQCVEAWAECWSHAQGIGREITALTVSAASASQVMVCVDAAGDLLGPGLYGTDERMAPDAKWLLSQLPGAAEDWQRITGQAPTSAHMVAKCSWLHRSHPDLWSRIAGIMPLESWFAAQLTGTPASITVAQAARTGFYSLPDAGYSRLICQIIDAERDLMACFPPVVSAESPVLLGHWNGRAVHSV